MKRRIRDYMRYYIAHREQNKGDKWDKWGYIITFGFYLFLLLIDFFQSW